AVSLPGQPPHPVLISANRQFRAKSCQYRLAVAEVENQLFSLQAIPTCTPEAKPPVFARVHESTCARPEFLRCLGRMAPMRDLLCFWRPGKLLQGFSDHFRHRAVGNLIFPVCQRSDFGLPLSREANCGSSDNLICHLRLA